MYTLMITGNINSKSSHFKVITYLFNYLYLYYVTVFQIPTGSVQHNVKITSTKSRANSRNRLSAGYQNVKVRIIFFLI